MTSGQAEHSYGGEINTRLLDFMGPLQGTVLDVGSGAGTWAPVLRQRGARRLLAIEPSIDADEAAGRYDEVFRGIVEELPKGFLQDVDLIIAADVLEHLPDPWTTLQQLRDGVRQGTRLVVSLPNAQCARMLLPILLKGRFDYSDEGGWLDVGHLRWFTERTLTDALRRTGWEPARTGGYVLGRMGRALMTASGGRARGMAYYQLHMDAYAV